MEFLNRKMLNIHENVQNMEENNQYMQNMKISPKYAKICISVPNMQNKIDVKILKNS